MKISESLSPDIYFTKKKKKKKNTHTQKEDRKPQTKTQPNS